MLDRLAKPLEPYHPILHASCFDTPLGPMLTIADEKSIFLLEFLDKPQIESDLTKLCMKSKSAIVPGITTTISSLILELDAYFQGKTTPFNTPIYLMGTPFQKRVWATLLEIPFGKTKTYKAQAGAIGSAKACRAVAQANSANLHAIIIPCHRIINSNGTLGGYSGGIERKQWLIAHEGRHV